MVYTLDLNFLGYPQSIAAYLVETSVGPVLIETGPYSTFEVLKNEIKRCGFEVDEIKHVFLSHIHLDHAGAAWALAEQGATIYLHPFGKTHLAHPEKLMESAKRIYRRRYGSIVGANASHPYKSIAKYGSFGRNHHWKSPLSGTSHTRSCQTSHCLENG